MFLLSHLVLSIHMVNNVRPYSANLYKFNVFFLVDKLKITKGEIKQYVVNSQNNISNA